MANLSFIGLCLTCACVLTFTAAKRERQRPDVTKLHVSSDIRFRYSVTTIESHVNNYNARASEVVFRVTLPRAAFISRFFMVIDNVTYPGDVKEKAAADEQYEKAKLKGESAGIIKQKPRESNVFAVNVNVAAKGDVDFTLVYEELLTRKFGRYEQAINIDPGQVVFDLRARVFIDESRPLTSVKAPPIRSGNEIAVVDKDAKNELAKIQRIGESQAVVEFAPSKTQQRAMSESGMSGQFVVQYDVDHKAEGGEIQVVDGYFVHFFSPSDLPYLAKHVYFILDVSGSMSGKKLKQMKEAMAVILDDLKEGDLFTIMQFSSNHENWRHGGDDVHLVTPRKIAAAKNFIKTLTTRGSTNIYDSLSKSLKDFNREKSNSISESNSFYRANVIVFLTDGQPTVGSITNTDDIVKAISEQNHDQNVVLYSLGFGNDVDFQFLQRLSLGNGGFARKIYESSDSALQLVDFYKEISSPLLANVNFVYIDTEVDKNSLTKTNFRIFFEGTEVVIAGKLAEDLPPPYYISSTVNGTENGGQLSWWCGTEMDRPAPTSDEASTSGGYLERLWAYLTIQQLLDKKTAVSVMKPPSRASATASPTTDVAAALKDIDAEILKLALKYDFVTPLTSMVVTKPDMDEHGGRNGTKSTSVVDDEEDMDYAYDDYAPQRSNAYMPKSSRPNSGSSRPHSGTGSVFLSANVPMINDYDDDSSLYISRDASGSNSAARPDELKSNVIFVVLAIYALIIMF